MIYDHLKDTSMVPLPSSLLTHLPTFLHSQLLTTPTLPPPTAIANKTCIVSGASSGLGLAAAQHLVALGAARVILAVRNLAAGDAARVAIEAATGRSGLVDVWHLDLGDWACVREFVARVERELGSLDVLLANAGVMRREWGVLAGEGETEEESVGVNVVGTFLLGLALVPAMRKASGGAVWSVVTSELHAFARFEERGTIVERGVFEALRREEGADMADRYVLPSCLLSSGRTGACGAISVRSRSGRVLTRVWYDDRYNVTKLLQVLLVRAIAPRLQSGADDTAPVIVLNAVNPGFCHSELRRDITKVSVVGHLVRAVELVLCRSAEVGARTLVTGVAAGADSHGEYMSDGMIVAPSAFAFSEEGRDVGEWVWCELREMLEVIMPGVTDVVRK